MAAGKYTRLREIGSGSFGKAFLVENAEGQQCVLKAIDLAQADARRRRDAANEVRVFSSLRHPYIIPYRESFLDGATLCIVMDFAEGGDLACRIAQARRAGQAFSEGRILRWLTEATLALKYLHERHVLHRDLKPRNLFLCGRGRLRLGDFGISKALDCTAALARTVTGTPYYLSPEICQERPYSWASDVWALGCVLFELAALRVPFQASGLSALVAKIVLGPAPALPARYSEDLRRIYSDMLQREERARPSAADLLRYPALQAEIKAMLREERACRRQDEVAAPPAAAPLPLLTPSPALTPLVSPAHSPMPGATSAAATAVLALGGRSICCRGTEGVPGERLRTASAQVLAAGGA